MTVKLRPLRSRTQLRSTRAGSRVLVHPKGLHENALSDFIRWCATEPGYTVVAVEVPPKTAPEALEDVVEDLAACPGVLRLIPSRLGSDSTLEYGSWLARRLGRTVVAHQGSVMIVPGGGLYIAPGPDDVGWLRFDPGSAPVPHSRRFPRPNWECPPFAESSALGPHAVVEPLPAGAWIRPAEESPDVLAFRRWLIGSVAADPLLPRVVLGYPSSLMPPIDAVAEFWRSLPPALQPGVRFAGFGGTDEGMAPYGQSLADALDAPVVLGNGVQLAARSAAGGQEMRTVLRHGVMSWSPYVGDLGYLPVRSTGGVPTDPVAIGHRAPIAGLQEREPGVYEYSHDAVLEVTQSGLWVRPPALPADSFSVRTEQPNPAHATVVFDATTRASAHRMQLLAAEMVQRLEPNVRTTARILASSDTGAALRNRLTTRVAVLERSQETEAAPATAPEAVEKPATNGAAPDESVLNLAALAGDAVQPAAPPSPVATNPMDLTAGATLHIPIETLLASLTAGGGAASGGGSAPANGEAADGSSWLDDFDDAPVPPAIALYALAWDPDPEAGDAGADLVSRTVTEVRQTQAPAPVAAAAPVLGDEPTQAIAPAVEDEIALVREAVIEAGPALGTVDAPSARPAPVSDSAVSAVIADPVVEPDRVVVTSSAAPMISEPATADAPPTQLSSGPLDASPPSRLTQVPANEAPVATSPAQLAPGPVDAAPIQPTQAPVDAPAAQFTVARRRQRKGRTVPAAPSQTTATPVPAEPVPNAVPAAVQPEPPAPAPAPLPEPVVEAPAPPPAPQPVEEPDEPIVYGAFQLVSSSAGPALGAPTAPSAPAPRQQSPVVPPTPPADQNPPASSTPAAPPAPPPSSPVTPPPAPPGRLRADGPRAADAAESGSADPDAGRACSPARAAATAAAPNPAARAAAGPRAASGADPGRAAAPAPVATPAAPPAPAPAAPTPAAPVQPPRPQPVEPAPQAQAQTPPAQPAPAKRRPARPAKPAVRVQPVPTAQCSVIPREGGLAKERDWLRRNLSKQYDAAASSVARILSEYPGLRAGSSASDTDVLTDLVALRLYLTGKISGLDAAVRAGQVGPHVPLARCAAAGLRRLPSYRGPLRTRVALTGDQVQWYGNRSLVTEWSFLPAVASSNLDLPGSAEILIWSMTARRTGLLDPSRPDQVVFQPGTSFKVLSVGTGQDGQELRLRELTRTEVAPDGTVQSIPALDEFAAAALEEAGKAWRQVDPVEVLPADRRDWFASPPGLLLAPAAPAAPAGGAREGGKA